MEIATGELAVATYYLALAAVVALVAFKGGRFERSMALTISMASVATFLAQFLLKQLVPIAPFTAIDLLVFVAIARTWWRHTRVWTSAAAGFQLVSLGIDCAYLLGIGPSERLYMTLLNMAYYAILGSIAFGVVRRRVGPPLPIPASPAGIGARRAAPLPIHFFWLHNR